jgi:hypothetical protein
VATNLSIWNCSLIIEFDEHYRELITCIILVTIFNSKSLKASMIYKQRISYNIQFKVSQSKCMIYKQRITYVILISKGSHAQHLTFWFLDSICIFAVLAEFLMRAFPLRFPLPSSRPIPGVSNYGFTPADLARILDQLQLVPLGGKSGPRRTSTELKFAVIYIRVQCHQPVGWVSFLGQPTISTRQILLGFYPSVQITSQFMSHNWELVACMESQ